VVSISVVVSCGGSGLWDELITLSEESYRVCVCVCVHARVCVRVRARGACVRAYLIVCGLGTSRMKRPRPSCTVHHRGEKKPVTSSVIFYTTHGRVPIEGPGKHYQQ
jgi:hypothetical protein